MTTTSLLLAYHSKLPTTLNPVFTKSTMTKLLRKCIFLFTQRRVSSLQLIIFNCHEWVTSSKNLETAFIKQRGMMKAGLLLVSKMKIFS
ncbi:MAG: battenin [Inoviridae sp.]|nr:MAG: battenin [Inoviridae sp.]